MHGRAPIMWLFDSQGGHRLGFAEGPALLSGILIVWLMMRILWYPQPVLNFELTIESQRARQVGGPESVTESNSPSPARSGKCPDCGAATPVEMRANGEINAACGIVVVTGMVHPEKMQYVALYFFTDYQKNAPSAPALVPFHR